MERMRVTIKQDGTSVVEVLEVSGPACTTTSKRLVEKLGEVISDEEKPEFYEQTESNKVQSGN